MGIPIFGAMMIQENETYVRAYSNEEKTKYGFTIYLMTEGKVPVELADTRPDFPYVSQSEAEKAGNTIMKLVKEMDLISPLQN